MPPAGFEPAIPVGNRSHTPALYRSATGFNNVILAFGPGGFEIMNPFTETTAPTMKKKTAFPVVSVDSMLSVCHCHVKENVTAYR